MTEHKRFLLKTIRKRQLQFFWHLIGANVLEKQTLSGKICGAKSKGRQRTKYTDSLNNFITRKESRNNDDDDDDDDDVHLFDPIGDGPVFLIILLVFMVIVSLILFI